jgi:hypothetical protein
VFFRAQISPFLDKEIWIYYFFWWKLDFFFEKEIFQNFDIRKLEKNYALC